MILKITKEFSETPGNRYITDGPFSGELFRDAFLIPKLNECINKNETLLIDLDGGYGCPVGFLEEAFGGLIRKGIRKEDIQNHLEYKSEEKPEIIDEINRFIKEEKIRKLKK